MLLKIGVGQLRRIVSLPTFIFLCGILLKLSLIFLIGVLIIKCYTFDFFSVTSSVYVRLVCTDL